VTERDKPAEQSEGVTSIGRDGAYSIFRVGSGDYRFNTAN